MTPSEQALIRLALARGWVGPEAHSISRHPDDELIQSLVRSGLLHGDNALLLRKAAKRTPFICLGCRAAIMIRELPPAGDLRCPRCGAPDLAPPPPSHGSGNVPVLPPAAEPVPAATRPSGMGRVPQLQPSGGGPVFPPGGMGRTDPNRLGVYNLEGELGRGSYGIVYKGRRAGLPRRFAIKVLDANRVSEEDLTRFQLEARLASKLEDPGVVGVIDVGQAENLHYYVMEYVQGPSLKEHLVTQGTLPTTEAAELVEKLARTLHYAHGHRVVHRDLKPANVLLDQGRPRITDFGLARDHAQIQRLTRSGEVVGTPYYMAPEQIRGKPSDHRVDVFALGVLLYELLTGRRPYEAGNLTDIARLQKQGCPSPRALLPEIPEPMERIVHTAMAYRPNDRYMNAKALAEDLAAFQRGEEPSHASGSGEGVMAAPPPSRGLLLVSMLLFMVLGVVVAAVVELRRGATPASPSVGAAPSPSASPRDSATPSLDLARLQAREGAPLRDVFDAYEAALKAAPKDAALRLEAAELLRRRGEWKQAEALLAPLLEFTDGVGFSARRLLAEIQECSGRRKEARATYQELSRIDLQGHLGLVAKAALARLAAPRDLEAWSRHARRAAASAPDEAVAARIELGLSMAGTGRGVALNEIIGKLKESAPDHPRVFFLLALQAMHQERLDDALSLVEKALGLTAGNGEPILLEARIALLLGLKRPDEALEAVTAHLERWPQDAAAEVQLGEALWLKGENAWFTPSWKARAVKAWREAYSRNAVVMETAVLSVLTPERASHVLTEVGSRRAPSPLNRVQVGKLLPESTRVLERRAALAAPAARDRLRKALFRCAEAASVDEVRALMERARKKAPQDPVVALERARFLVGREVFDEAREALASAKALGVDPREVEYLEADLAFLRGRNYQAAPHYERLAHANREDRVGRLSLIKHWFGHQEGDKAFRALEAARKALPDDYEVHRIHAHLIMVGSQGRAHKKAEAAALRAMSLGGAIDVRTWSTLMNMKEVALVVDARGRPRNVGPKGMKQVLADYDEAIKVCDGPTLRLSGAQLILSLILPKDAKRKLPHLNRARRWLVTARESQPERGSTYFMLGQLLLEEHAPAEEVLKVWNEGLKVESRLLFSPDSMVRFRELHGDHPGLKVFEKRLSKPGVHIGKQR